MNWGTLLSTLIGAVIGVGSTLLADRVRWRRELERQAKESRRELYARFLTALNEATEALWVVGLGDRRVDGPESLAEVLRGQVHRSGLYSYREQIMILAPPAVLREADLATDRVREYRDVLISGHAAGSAEEGSAMHAYTAALKALRQVMRADLAS
jgi:hypothetical protein